MFFMTLLHIKTRQKNFQLLYILGRISISIEPICKPHYISEWPVHIGFMRVNFEGVGNFNMLTRH